MLRFEPLEERRLLAAVTVGNHFDEVDGDTSSIESLISTPGDDGISLREAILAANATPGADEILFAESLVGATIVLDGTELEIGEALSIDARPLATKVTIDADQMSRVFNITATTGDVTLAGLTLTRGRTTASDSAGSGGAVRSLTTGLLTLERSIVTGNRTSGARALGGGVYAFGGLAIHESTIHGNQTDHGLASGGGVATLGEVLIRRSTISGNISGGSGGGLYHGSSSHTTSQDVSVVRSTISGNIATNGGGLANVAGHLEIAESTVSHNTGGIFVINQGSLTIAGSIVAKNRDLNGGSFDVSFSGIPTPIINYTLIGDESAGSILGDGNLFEVDPLLRPLGDYGGPTQTHALSPDSPAIDAGDADIAADPAEFDQRGGPFVRVFDGDGQDGPRVDIGAFELQTLPDSHFVVDTLNDELDGDYSPGDVSLRDAISAANGSFGADVVSFDAELFSSPQTIELVLGQLSIFDSLTIDGPGRDRLTIDAGQRSRIFNIEYDAGDVSIAGLTISDGRTTGSQIESDTIYSGGAIRAITTGQLTITASTITGNSTTGDRAQGGGIFALSPLFLSDSIVSGNHTAGEYAVGGGISAANLVLVRTTVAGNSTAQASGGGLFAFGEVDITRSTVSGNEAAGGFGGGGIMHAAYGPGTGEVLTLSDSTVSGNISGHPQGNGIQKFYGELIVQRSTITDNEGGISAVRAGVVLHNSIVSGNSFSPAGVMDFQLIDSFMLANYSIIGSGGELIVPGVGNIFETDPLLGRLSDHGGPTQTHEPLPESPAIDAGDMAAIADPDEFDQRGNPFVRVYDGDGEDGPRIDIGAYEVQPFPPAFFGDYNQSGDVDAADFVAWRRQRGQQVAAPYDGADGNGDQVIDEKDYQVWRRNFGRTLPEASGAVAAVPREPIVGGVSDADLAIDHNPSRNAQPGPALGGSISRIAPTVAPSRDVAARRIVDPQLPSTGQPSASLLLAARADVASGVEQQDYQFANPAPTREITSRTTAIDDFFALAGLRKQGWRNLDRNPR